MAGLADHVAGWMPEPVEQAERIGPWPAAAFAAMIDQPSPVVAAGAPLPPLWHRLHFLEAAPQAELGEDGHPREGHFLPPVPDRRRMFAGGRLDIAAPIRIGDEIVRRSEITSVVAKSGRSGEMLFVTLRQEFRRGGELLAVEEEDAVYRRQEPGAARAAAPAAEAADEPAGGPWRAELVPDEAMLFRFSALTYNAHRIHYDLPYVVDVEGFPGLVVHGPLLALLLLELPRRHAAGQAVQRFEYRLRRPAYGGPPVVATGGPGAQLVAGVAGAPPAITGTVALG